MDDPKTRYGAPGDSATVARPHVPGYLSLEAPLLTPNNFYDPTDLQGSVLRPYFPGYLSSEPPSLRAQHADFPGALLQRDIGSFGPGAYAADNISGVGVRPELGNGATSGVSTQGYPSALDVPTLPNQRQEFSIGISPCENVERSTESPSYLRNDNGFTHPKGESNVLFVDGLPTDCTRREVGHLFRPFIGFREIKVVHKGSRRSGDKAMVLCFVEFVDEKCALTAMEALQGYKFDNKKPDSPVLRIQFAHFPFSLPSYHDEKPIRR
ncbi:RNA-binding protein 1 isoform X1 [Ziziphus jujuba]|uniref:RNA-binding protein 1 isoform X1 n=1 Tax=Ziziphus jujuba TaxID=326968 RepID=A0A6P6FNV4_ZIZJJ|nr:RNA-binding protein 1 isoform X1 [Ziziphus jujuba]